MKNIKIGKNYSLFDNGVVSSSRHYNVTVLEIIPFDKMKEYSQEIFKLWEEEKEGHPYNISTDFFIKTTCEELEDVGLEDFKHIYFVEGKNNTVWSLGEYAGVLDVDGDLTKQIQQRLLEDGFNTFEIGDRKVFSKKYYKNNEFYYRIFIYINSVFTTVYFFVNESNLGDLITKLHLYKGDTFIQHINF